MKERKETSSYRGRCAPRESLHDDLSRPLNGVGLPYYDNHLLSSYDSILSPSSSYTPPPPKIPPEVLQTVRVQDHLQYAMLPKELQGHRNVVNTSAAGRKAAEGRFRSDLARRAVAEVSASFIFVRIKSH